MPFRKESKLLRPVRKSVLESHGDKLDSIANTFNVKVEDVKKKYEEFKKSHPDFSEPVYREMVRHHYEKATPSKEIPERTLNNLIQAMRDVTKVDESFDFNKLIKAMRDVTRVDEALDYNKLIASMRSVTESEPTKLTEKAWKYKIELTQLQPYLTGDKDVSEVDAKELSAMLIADIDKALATTDMSVDLKGRIKTIARESESAEDVEDFDKILGDLYDLADENSIWINVVG